MAYIYLRHYARVQEMKTEEQFRITLECLESALEKSENQRRLIQSTINDLENGTADRVERVFMVLEASKRLFGGNAENAVLWCVSPAIFLSGAMPINMVSSDQDVELVLENIGRLENGIPL